MAAPSAPLAFAQAENPQQTSALHHPVHVPNPFRVNLPEAPSPNLQQLLNNASQVLHSARTQGFEASTSHAQEQEQQEQQQQQEPMNVSWVSFSLLSLHAAHCCGCTLSAGVCQL